MCSSCNSLGGRTEVDARGEVVKFPKCVGGAVLGVADTHPSIVFRRTNGGSSESAKETWRRTDLSCGRGDNIGWRSTGAETRRTGAGGDVGAAFPREEDR